MFPRRPAGGKALIVDDQESNVVLLEDVLDEAGVGERRSVTDSRLALAAADDFRPDLVLLDLMMPHLDGFGVMEGLFGGPWPAPLVLMLTADDSPATKRRALAAGAADFLAKPFDPVEAMLRVSGLLERRRLENALAARNRELESRVQERTRDLADKATELERELGMKRMMLKELNHRVRNNLATVAAMLNLQVARAADPSAAAAIASCRDRVHAMSLAHESAYDENLSSALPCGRIAEAIVEHYRQRDIASGAGGIEYLDRGSGALVDLDAAVPLSVLLNELLSNARVHGGPGPVKVEFTAGADGISLSVRDGGPGLPPGFSLEGAGFGLTLARMMAEQAGGSLEASSPGGALFTLHMPTGGGAC